ncbi:beta-eliminating lyase-related protein [Massilia sp. MB5]|uniref:threonine aldolase family protein n=1 Tax=Massilia sp. MB5 TaxID=2919578 RepID=UPI001F1177CB|nr:beta-eliminating lyase-related protein [Massilia sp. MB5]UMR29192.1 beta-eliminating lyase-related protein [Massilia sp. MB5]
MTDAELRQNCHTVLPGHRQPTPAETFAAMAAWCEANKVVHDVYGEGELIQSFERKVADLLGFEAAVFCITGTMTQVTALRLACAERGSRLVALHPSAHILKHEKGNHQLLGHFDALQLGDPFRPFTLDELQALPDRLGAVALELPAREIGGQCPAWDELEAIKTHCRQQGIHLHMDGARLWEAAAGYGRPLNDVAAGFDSVYVSLYKGIGGLGGALLLGSAAFVARAQEWFRREGGNVIHRTPYVVAAAMQFDARLAALPACMRRTEWLYGALAGFPLFKLNPARPQANMLHIHLPVSRDRALEIRNHIAERHGIWLFNRASHSVLPSHSYVEWYVGENMLSLADERVLEALNLWHAALGEGAAA